MVDQDVASWDLMLANGEQNGSGLGPYTHLGLRAPRLRFFSFSLGCGSRVVNQEHHFVCLRDSRAVIASTNPQRPKITRAEP